MPPNPDIGRLARRLGSSTLQLLRELGRTASDLGCESWLVGGVVRDVLLARSGRSAGPLPREGDVDVVVAGDVRAVAARLSGEVRWHPRFQTATVGLADGTRLDLSRARSESYRHPAALPDVQPAGIEQDLLRRDFTINALALALFPGRFGTLLDPTGGVDDLRRESVRVLHEKSFVDDPTRAFRAVRYSSRLGFSVEGWTARLLRASVDEGRIDALSADRLRREVELLYGEPEVVQATRLLSRYGLLATLHPALRPTRETYRRLKCSGPELERYEALAQSRPFPRWLVPFGLLIGGLAAVPSAELLDRLRPGRRERRTLQSAATEVPALTRALASRRPLRASTVYLTCRGRHPSLLLMAAATTRQARVRRALRRFLELPEPPGLEIDGRTLLRRGVPQGPAVARGLEAALLAKLDGRAPDAAAQLRRALRAASEGPGERS